MPYKFKIPLSWVLVSCFLALFSLNLNAQKTVTGKVTGSKDKLPLAGTTVIVKGTNTATQTDEAGTFKITVPSDKSVLVFTAVGFERMEISTSGRTSVSPELKESTSSLNEIVVTGYTAQRKKDITGAVSVVNVANLKTVPAGTGEEALQGQAAGVTIITSGQPGAASDIRIRGITSFGNNQPLVLIDGVSGSLHDLNTNDIESIQILKDASASIYGVRGSNGVIIITTKKGKAGKVIVNYEAHYGFQTPGKGFDLASPQEVANAVWLQNKNSGIASPSTKQYGSGVNPVLPEYITPYGFTPTTPAQLDSVNPNRYDINNYQITKANKAGTDWYHAIMKNAPLQSHTLTLSGGYNKSSYLFSVGYLNQEGVLLNTGLKRYSVRLNTQTSIHDHIRIGENAYIFYKVNPTVGNQGEGNPISFSYRESNIIPIYDIKGNFAGTKSQDLGNSQNPFANASRMGVNVGNDWEINGNVYAEVDILKHFLVRTSIGGNVNNQYYHSFSYVGYENAEGNTGSNSFNEGASYNSSKTWTNTLKYSNTFGKHSVTALVGTEAISYYGRGESATRGNYFSTNPNFWTVSTGSPAGASNAGYAYQSSIYSQFGQLQYNYNDRYLINGTIRRDGSSVFYTGRQYGYFPSVSAAWRISQENFFKGVSFVNDLKLRYSWGKLGSASNVPGTNPFSLYASNVGRSAYDLGASNTNPTAGFYASSIGNQKTTWEGDIITNIGLDATLLNNKFDLTVEWYKKKVSGLLFPAQYDILYRGDAQAPFINIGDMQNTGVDASLTYHGVIQKKVRFDVTGLFTSYNNKITSIPGTGFFTTGGSRNGDIVKNAVGHPVSSFYGYQVIGIFQSDADVAKSPTQQDAAPGRFKYADVNGDGKITTDDRTYFGNPNPKFTYGLNLSLSYSNFDFSAFFFGSYGNDIFNGVKIFTDFPQLFKGGLSKDAALNSWTPTNTNTKVPKLENLASFSTTTVINSYYLDKGSYFRSKQMALGYTLPGKILGKYGIEKFRIYVQAVNLFTVTKYKGLDPELQSSDPNNQSQSINGASNSFGIDYGNYPHTAQYLIGVNVNF
jgi:TonB-linked SusC/RagA family outer membrane protein